jgi:hypothetical protein
MGYKDILRWVPRRFVRLFSRMGEHDTGGTAQKRQRSRDVDLWKGITLPEWDTAGRARTDFYLLFCKINLAERTARDRAGQDNTAPTPAEEARFVGYLMHLINTKLRQAKWADSIAKLGVDLEDAASELLTGGVNAKSRGFYQKMRDVRLQHSETTAPPITREEAEKVLMRVFDTAAHNDLISLVRKYSQKKSADGSARPQETACEDMDAAFAADAALDPSIRRLAEALAGQCDAICRPELSNHPGTLRATFALLVQKLVAGEQIPALAEIPKRYRDTLEGNEYARVVARLNSFAERYAADLGARSARPAR